MDKVELRLKLIDIVSKNQGLFSSENVLDSVKRYEAFVMSDIVDKELSPTAPVKEQRKGSAVSTKKKPRKG